MHTPAQCSSLFDGESLSLGGLYWPRPYFPTRAERATLISEVIPSWATPSGITAAWIWTGMGLPTPLCVLRPAAPAISPLERERWKARELRSHKHGLVQVAGYQVLDPPSAEKELLRSPQSIDLLATQIFFLRSLEFPLPDISVVRLSAAQRERATLIMERVQELTELYPDITRYTS